MRIRTYENVMNIKKCYKIVLISSFALTVMLQSCYKDKFDFSNMNDTVELSAQMGLPVAYGSLTLRDLIKAKKDTIELYREGEGDTLIRFVFNIDTIKKYRAVDFFRPPVLAPITRTIPLGVVSLDTQNSDDSISFNTFIRNHFSQVDTLYYDGIKGISTNVLAKVGSKNARYNFKYLPNISWVYTLTGDVNIKLTNTYAVPLSCKIDLKTDLTGLNEGTPSIGIFDFTASPKGKGPIAPGTSQTITVPVVGFKISSKIFYEITDVSFGAKNPAKIGMNDKLFMGLELANLKVSSGVAKIPSQKKPIKTDSIWFDLLAIQEGKTKKIKQIDVLNGILNFDITSKIPGLIINMKLPSAKDAKGDTVKLSYSFPQPGTIHKEWDMSSCKLFLDKNPLKPYNSLQVILSYNIDSKGADISFNQTDSCKIVVSNTDSIRYRYIRGDLGSDTMQIENKKFDFNIDKYIGTYFNGVAPKFTAPSIKLSFTNSTGIPASVNFNLKGEKKGIPTRSLYDKPEYLNINPADPTNVPAISPIPVTTVIPIDAGNSQIVDFISDMPNSIVAGGQIITNYGSNSSTNNFITNDSYVSAQLNAEVPLQFSMNGVVLMHDFPLSPQENVSIDALGDDDQFKITLYAKNQFPVDISVKVILMDSIKNIELGVLNKSIIESAVTENGVVSRNQFKRFRTDIILSKNENPTLVQNFLKANKIRIEATLNTDRGKPVTIYSYYSISFQLGVNAKMKLKKSLNFKK